MRAIGYAIDVGRERDVPISVVSAEEGEIDASFGRRLHVVVLRLSPVFVVAHINISLRIEQQRAVGRRVDPGDIIDAVAVLLQPIDGCIFFAK